MSSTAEITMKLNRLQILLLSVGLLVGVHPLVRAQGVATSLTGLYNTGVSTTGALLSTAGGGVQDPSWTVVNAVVGTGEGELANSAYLGTTYVLATNGGYNGNTLGYGVNNGWIPDNSVSEWITAPGAYTGSNGGYGTAAGPAGTVNYGGDNLPGQGPTPANVVATNANGGTTPSGYGYEAFYTYQTTFNVNGSGTGLVSNVILNLSIASDDGFEVLLNGHIVNSVDFYDGSTYTAVGAMAVTLNSSNANYFVIGTNTLQIIVANNGGSSATTNQDFYNASGLNVAATWTIVPEVGAWLPGAVALMLYGGFACYRRASSRSAGPTHLSAA
jgi:hypothetical protein